MIVNPDHEIEISVEYFEFSSASGAFVKFVHVTDEGNVDLTKTIFTTISRNTSTAYVLLYSLSPGQYNMFVYDIEQNQTLSSGVGYPAVAYELFLNQSTNGELAIIDIILWLIIQLYSLRFYISSCLFTSCQLCQIRS